MLIYFFCSIPDRSVRREPQNGREQRLRRRIGGGGGGGGRGGVAASAADDEPGQDLDLAPLVRALSLAGPAAAPLHLRPQVLATARPAAGGATVDRPGRPAHRRGPFFFACFLFFVCYCCCCCCCYFSPVFISNRRVPLSLVSIRHPDKLGKNR